MTGSVPAVKVAPGEEIKNEWMPSRCRRGFGFLAALLTSSAARAQEPLHLRLGWAVIPGQLVAILYSKPDILKHYGKSYTIETIRFRGSAPQITALASDQIDIAAFAFSTLALAIQNAHMDDVRVIGDLYQDGISGYYANEYAVRADSDIKRVEDLKGKVVASNGIGGAADMGLRKMLRAHGLEIDRDYQLVEIEFPNMLTALTAKKIDLGAFVMPFAYIGHQQGAIRTLFTIRDSMGETQATLMAARAPFIAAHRAALVDFFEDTQVALHWFYDPKHRDAVLGILAGFTKEPESDFSPGCSSRARTITAILTRGPISRRCKTTSIPRSSWDSSTSTST